MFSVLIPYVIPSDSDLENTSMADWRIDTAAGRNRLVVRREPYWQKVPDLLGCYVGYRAGPGTWIARMRDEQGGPTAQKYRSLGRFSDFRDAVKAARSWAKGRDAGITDDKVTVADACQDYLRVLLEEKGEPSFKEQRSRLQRTLIGRTVVEAREQRCRPVEPHPLACRQLSRVRRMDLTNWREKLVPAALKGEQLRKARASVNRELATLLAVLNHAHRVQLVNSNAAWAGIRKFKNVSARDASYYVSSDERRRLVDAAQGNVKDFLTGLCLLGCRPLELTRCVVADYDSRAGTLHLYSFKGNIRRDREVPLRALDGAETLVKRLCQSKLPSAPIWTRHDGNAWAHSDWDHLVRDARDSAGLHKKVTAYALRHSFITDAISGDVDILTVAKITGTSIEMINRTYGKLIESVAVRQFKKITLL